MVFSWYPPVSGVKGRSPGPARVAACVATRPRLRKAKDWNIWLQNYVSRIGGLFLVEMVVDQLF
jgi:hypothetical protein